MSLVFIEQVIYDFGIISGFSQICLRRVGLQLCSIVVHFEYGDYPYLYHATSLHLMCTEVIV